MIFGTVAESSGSESFSLWDFLLSFLRIAHLLRAKKTFDTFFTKNIQAQVSFYPLPRAIDTTVFKDYGLQKDVDVTLLGALDADFYPLRTYFNKTLQQHTGITYVNHSHPGYTYANQDSSHDSLKHDAYAKAINRSHIFLSCTGKYAIPFIKLYEVLACKTLLMCNSPMGAADIGLKDGENYVAVDKVNVMEKIRYYLRKPKEIERIANNGYQLVRKRHTVDIRAKEFTGMVENVLRDTHVHGARRKKGAKTKKVSLSALKRSASHIKRYLCGRRERACIARMNPWPEPEDLSRMDASLVLTDRHILDFGLTINHDDYKRFLVYGMNTNWTKIPPVITQHPELVIYRSIYLRTLAQNISAKTCGEIGTARGLQSITWAHYLEDNAITDGTIYTCDIDDHATPHYQTPLTRAQKLSRSELWAQDEAAHRIHFVHGDSSVLSRHITKPLDIVYIDGAHTYTAVMADFAHLEKHLSATCVIIFDDCDVRFPGVEQAVSDIVRTNGGGLEMVSFWPSYYKIAIYYVYKDA